ncbi:mycofactocin-coupled SDR family oxidoreductase [Pseudogracilibacillus sp. SO10305]|uniref:mycofactocin-coupled SDR family oxidoreductase n=1 Tax=Pseudogracilibacillus sp. SO10305 TaxID=3098292 RepID=UPI00300E685F
MKRLEGQVAFVTGAARGQGRQFALALAKEGADVVVLDLDTPINTVDYELPRANTLKDVAKEIEQLGQRSLAIVGDVTKEEDMSRAVEVIIDKFGKIDILVPNAGIVSYGKVWELDGKTFDKMIDVNLKGTWLTCKFVAPHMIERRSGKIVCISSIYSVHAAPLVSHYTASKHGVLGLVRSMAMELGEYNINVNTIGPTAIDTPMMNNQATFDRMAGGKEGGTREHANKEFEKRQLLPNAGYLPDDACVGALLFLASDDSKFVTGSYIPVDAGFLTF